MDNGAISLFELSNRIKDSIHDAFPDRYRVVAEISELKEARNGHCYLELIQKSEDGNTIIARSRATIWSFVYRMIKPYFESTTGQILTYGIKILVSVSVEYHELYGFSLNIQDIDPTYTMGDIVRKRKEILDRLQKEGILDMNRELSFPEVPRKIAVISAPNAAGFGDFVQHLDKNPYGYRFYWKLFPAYMQGDKAEESILLALDHIFEYEEFFDVVVIIRGGGAVSDLSCFDSYNLACTVAQFPLPVVSGIGHEKDDTILDYVAFKKVKTPTAAADFLISAMMEAEGRLEQIAIHINETVTDILISHRNNLEQINTSFGFSVKEILKKRERDLSDLIFGLRSGVRIYINKEASSNAGILGKMKMQSGILIRNRAAQLVNISRSVKNSGKVYLEGQHVKISFAEKSIQLVNPVNILKRGYSITYQNGKVLKRVSDAKSGSEIEIVVSDGAIKGKVL